MKTNDFEQALDGLETVIGWLVEDHHDLATSAVPPEFQDRRRRLEYLCDFGRDLTQICSAAEVLISRLEMLADISQEAGR